MALIIWESYDSADVINEFGEYCFQEITPILIKKTCSNRSRIIAKGNKYQGIGI